MKFETLKDLKEKIKKAKFSFPTPTEEERQGYIRLQLAALDLAKQKAIKWVKHLLLSKDKNRRVKCMVLKEFFNITREDLK